MVAKAGLWSIIASLIEKVLALGTYVLVVRDVDKADFGNLVIVLLIIELVGYVSGFGINQNIIRRRELSDVFMANAFKFTSYVSICILCMMCLFVSPLAFFLSGVDLALLILIMALYPCLVGFSNFYLAILEREMRFKEIALRSAGVSLLSGLSGVILAYGGAGIFAIIISRYVYTFSNILILKLITKYKVSKVDSFEYLRELYSFGWKLSVSQLFNFSSNRIYEISITLFFGSVYVGIVDVARKLLITLYQVILMPLNSVSLSYVAKSEFPENTYFNFINYVSLLVVPLIAVLGALSQPVVNTLFGTEWKQSAVILELLSLGVIVQISLWFINSFLITINRSDLLLKLQIINFCTLLSFIFIGWFFSLDFVDFIKILLFALFFSTLIRVLYLRFFIGFSLSSFTISVLKSAFLYFYVYFLTKLVSLFYNSMQLFELKDSNFVHNFLVLGLVAFTSLFIFLIPLLLFFLIKKKF